MKVALVSIRIDRNTNKVINREIKETKEVDEDEFYEPLVKVLGDSFLKEWKGEDQQCKTKELNT